jgi:hypothetical protein
VQIVNEAVDGYNRKEARCDKNRSAFNQRRIGDLVNGKPRRSSTAVIESLVDHHCKDQRNPKGWFHK